MAAKEVCSRQEQLLAPGTLVRTAHPIREMMRVGLPVNGVCRKVSALGDLQVCSAESGTLPSMHCSHFHWTRNGLNSVTVFVELVSINLDDDATFDSCALVCSVKASVCHCHPPNA